MKHFLILIISFLPIIMVGQVDNTNSAYNHNELKRAMTYQPQSVDLEKSEKVYYPNSNLKEEKNNKYGKLNGAYKSYYENGKLKNEGYYKNNQRKGFWKFYYENGNVKKKVNYRYGKLRGYFRSYYNNGQLESEGNFIDIEVKDGLWTFYDEDGKLQEQHLYKDKILILKKMYDNSDGNSDVKILGKYTPLSRPMKWGK